MPINDAPAAKRNHLLTRTTQVQITHSTPATTLLATPRFLRQCNCRASKLALWWRPCVQVEIEKKTDTVITTQGRFYPPGQKHDPNDPPLYLNIKPLVIPGQVCRS